MNTKHIEHDGQHGSGRRSLVGGKVATVFAVVIAGVVGASAFLAMSNDTQAPAEYAGAVAFAAPAQISALPAISPNAVGQHSPSF